LAKIGKTDVKIDFSQYIGHRFFPKSGFAEVKEHIAEFEAALQGEPLAWALDRYYEAIFYNTAGIGKELITPLVEPRKQQFYNNPAFGTDLTVRFHGSQTTIEVHRVLLGIFSERLKCTLFTARMNDCANGSYYFQDSEHNCYSEDVVTALLSVIYGCTPAYEGSDPVELLKLANEIESEQFTDSVNSYFNKVFDKNSFKVDDLVNIMLRPYWTRLGQLGSFFKAVSRNWADIIEAFSEEDQKSLRERFYGQWLDFVAKPVEVLPNNL